MKRVKAIVTYDGSNFSGYQVQPNKRTVQGELQRALASIHKVEKWHVTGSGRTDTGVHSRGQTIHYDTTLSIPEERWPMALNNLLPADISVRTATYVPEEFHARYDTVGKEYVYLLNTNREKNVFNRNFSYHHHSKLSYDKMVEGASHLLGTHDFTSFSSPKTSVVDKIRTIYSIRIDCHDNEWTFRYIGSGFLYQMVRVLTGTFIEIGKGEISAGDIPEIISVKNRFFAGPTVPGKGLYLEEVFYSEADLSESIRRHSKKN